jgi:diguanylate cyclase (GGDEF)-like protein
VITDVAELLKCNVRPNNPVFRYGGEEFAVLLQGQDEQGGWLLAERLREAVAATEFGGITVTISVGVAQWQPGDSSDAVIARADRALYAAKNQGRNRSVRASAFTDA